MMVKVYLLNLEDFLLGEIYCVGDFEDEFIISYLNGVFVWGYRILFL